MCYDVSVLTKTKKEYADRYGQGAHGQQLLLFQLENIPTLQHLVQYHANGFTQPYLPVITNENPDIIQFYQWGLIPFWVKDSDVALRLARSTINARGETIFIKPSFKAAAQYHRCLVIVDGFFEHRHAGGKTYPYYIYHKNGKPLTLAGLWQSWYDREFDCERLTVSIVTTKANAMMAQIHNNSKLKEARMPFILDEETEGLWLSPLSKPDIKSLIVPYAKNDLACHTVHKIRGKYALGNNPQSIQVYNYEKLSPILQ